MNVRKEADSVGTMNIPADAYYGIHALRAKNNFPITGYEVQPQFIRSMAMVKKAAIITNFAGGDMPEDIAKAVEAACDEVLDGKLFDQFIVDPIQGGAGTSYNMNCNEVIANRASELLGAEKGSYRVHPNDHVNMGQSTNDVIPTAGKLTVLMLLQPLEEELKNLCAALEAKEKEFEEVYKFGRTQLQDAVPMKLSQSFGAHKTMVQRSIKRLEKCRAEMLSVNLGGTAIGSGINASAYYLKNVVPMLAKLSGFNFEQAADLFDATENLDCFVAVSGEIKAIAVSLSKMCNDLRLLSSGPRTGIGEINLPAKQNGSSIMPGKINPVIPEVVSQVAFMIAGNDLTITMAAEAGQLELNAFEPVIFQRLFESLTSLAAAVNTLRVNCVEGITANEERCSELLNRSVGIVTALCPILGYTKSAELAKKALKSGKSISEVVLEEGLIAEDELKKIFDPKKLVG